jgi:hypothetical protein
MHSGGTLFNAIQSLHAVLISKQVDREVNAWKTGKRIAADFSKLHWTAPTAAYQQVLVTLCDDAWDEIVSDAMEVNSSKGKGPKGRRRGAGRVGPVQVNPRDPRLSINL